MTNPDSSYSETLTGQVQIPSVEMRQQISEVFYQNKLKLKMNVKDYNINDQMKLQIKYYESKF